MMIFKIKSRENKPRARRWAWHVCWRRLGRWSMAMALCLTRRDAQSLSHIPRFSANQANIPLLYKSIQHKIRVMWDRGPQPLSGTGPHSRSEQSIIWFTATPIAHSATWAPPRVGSAAALDSHRSLDPAVNCTWRAPRCVLLMRI